MYPFARNCHSSIARGMLTMGPLTVAELEKAEVRWLKITQHVNFPEAIVALGRGREIPCTRLLTVCPFLNEQGVLHVEERQSLSTLSFS